jgi:uncharacterized membrane protein
MTMAKVETSIFINAPVEKVFGYFDEPANHLEIWPGWIEVTDVQRLPNGGFGFRWMYKMAGIRLEGTTQTIEHVPNQRIVGKSKGTIETTQIFTFQPEDGGTKVTFEIDYTLPIPLLGRLVEAVVVKQNQREVELVAANLKARMEA